MENSSNTIDGKYKYALSIEETAKALRVSRPTVYNLVRSVDFPAFKVGRRTLISADGLRDWIAKQLPEVRDNEP